MRLLKRGKPEPPTVNRPPLDLPQDRLIRAALLFLDGTEGEAVKRAAMEALDYRLFASHRAENPLLDPLRDLIRAARHLRSHKLSQHARWQARHYYIRALRQSEKAVAAERERRQALRDLIDWSESYIYSTVTRPQHYIPLSLRQLKAKAKRAVDRARRGGYLR